MLNQLLGASPELAAVRDQLSLIVCEMSITQEAEMNRLIDGLADQRRGEGGYLVLGTLGSRTWRAGLTGRATIEDVKDDMADFKAYMRVDITPRHWSRERQQAN